jgi:hypothetical protein
MPQMIAGLAGGVIKISANFNFIVDVLIDEIRYFIQSCTI